MLECSFKERMITHIATPRLHARRTFFRNGNEASFINHHFPFLPLPPWVKKSRERSSLAWCMLSFSLAFIDRWRRRCLVSEMLVSGGVECGCLHSVCSILAQHLEIRSHVEPNSPLGLNGFSHMHQYTKGGGTCPESRPRTRHVGFGIEHVFLLSG